MRIERVNMKPGMLVCDILTYFILAACVFFPCSVQVCLCQSFGVSDCPKAFFFLLPETSFLLSIKLLCIKIDFDMSQSLNLIHHGIYLWYFQCLIICWNADYFCKPCMLNCIPKTVLFTDIVIVMQLWFINPFWYKLLFIHSDVFRDLCYNTECRFSYLTSTKISLKGKLNRCIFQYII